MEDVVLAIKNRRSIRRYKPIPVPIKPILQALDVATSAPSAHNAQPWRFIVIKKDELKRKLALAMGDSFRRDLIRDGLPMGEVEEKVQDSVTRFSKAPILILVCLTMKGMDKYPDERRQVAEHAMAIQSVAAAIQNLLVALHVKGLGSCWYCAPLFCQGEVKRVLGMPKDWEPQSLVTIGYPDETPPSPSKLDFDEVVRLDS